MQQGGRGLPVFMNLLSRTLVSLVALAVIMGLLVFVPAGTLHYWQGWLFFVAFFVPSLLLSLYLAKNDPALLERRMKGGPTAEKRPAQKIIMLLASLAFIGLLVIPAVFYRLRGTTVPIPLEILGEALVLLGFYCTFLVYRENSYTSATIEIAKDQKVISTGPYAVVRHPMYASAALYVIGIPLALGSYWGLLASLLLMSVVIWRLLDEERFLVKGLPGYLEYQRKVRYRLIPHVW
jgi:protein-S-isoprenylcysteine O-methyltransferase Ste14